MPLPRIFRLRQHFEGPSIDDVPQRVRQELARLKLAERMRAGQSVAVTAGSRGIHDLASILIETIAYLRAIGAEPFIVPAMGSHGGATASGQLAVLERYGVTPAACGCPIRSSMDTVEVTRAAEGFPVYFDRQAFQADHVLVVNRVKPHTRFTGPIQSGLMKMLLIGLGKHEGAKVYHRAIQDFSFEQILHRVAGEVIERCRIVGGLAILENGMQRTAWIEGVEPHAFARREPELLQMACGWMPGLPFREADILIVDRIGKDISGTGMDTNVIGRKTCDHHSEEGEPRMRRIVVRGLTEATHGNGAGIGMAEFALTRAVEALDLQATRENCLTAGHPTAAMIPVHFKTDRQVLDAASGTLGLTAPEDIRLMWISDTLDLAEVECSQAYWDEAQRLGLEVVQPPRPMPFSAGGMLPDCSELGRPQAAGARADAPPGGHG